MSLSNTLTTLVAPVLFVTSIPSIPSFTALIWLTPIWHNSIKPRSVEGLTKLSLIRSDNWFVSELIACILNAAFALQ